MYGKLEDKPTVFYLNGVFKRPCLRIRQQPIYMCSRRQPQIRDHGKSVGKIKDTIVTGH